MRIELMAEQVGPAGGKQITSVAFEAGATIRSRPRGLSILARSQSASTKEAEDTFAVLPSAHSRFDIAIPQKENGTMS